MSENMSICVNGQSQVPPGFRFHPTEEELLHYYLKKKVLCEKIDLDVIRDVDLNKLEPWDIQEKCNIGSTPQNDWYFFSHKDKKYPTGTRTNRATAAGFWKATGRDKVIYSSGIRIGMRKTLVFYKGRAPHGQKSDWIMHEYRLDDISVDANCCDVMGDAGQEEGWVICRIFKKKNHFKTLTNSPSGNQDMLNCCSEGAFDQIFEHMGRPSEEDINNRLLYQQQQYSERFLKLPNLETSSSSITTNSQNPDPDPNLNPSGLSNWVALDRLVASQLNGQTEHSRQLACFSDPNLSYTTNSTGEQPNNDFHLPNQKSPFLVLPSSRPHQAIIQDYNSEIELWNFATRS